MGKKPVKKRSRLPPSISLAVTSTSPIISPFKKLSDGNSLDGEDGMELKREEKGRKSVAGRISSYSGDALRMLACSASDLKMKSLAETKSFDTAVSKAAEDEDGKSSDNEEEESMSKELSEDSGNVVGQISPLTEQLDSQTATDDEQEVSSYGEEEEEDFQSEEEEEEIEDEEAAAEEEDEEELKEQSSNESNGNEDEDSIDTQKFELKSTHVNEQLSKKEPTSGKRFAIPPPNNSKKKKRAVNKVAEMGKDKVLFVRIWNNEDELALLQGILKYKDRYHTIPFNHTHAEALSKLVEESLSISVSLSQIVDKVRRMKKKYINTIGRLTRFKQSKILDPHNAAVFNMSKKIWGCLDKEQMQHESNITVKKEDFNKKTSILKHFGEDYPFLYWRLKSEYSNVALIVHSLMSKEVAKELEEKCKQLDKMNIQINQKKFELLASTIKLIEEVSSKN